MHQPRPRSRVWQCGAAGCSTEMLSLWGVFDDSATFFALNPAVNPEVVSRPARRAFGSQGGLAFGALTLVLLSSGAAVYESIRLSSLTSSDVWIHLRTGTWMLEKPAIPRSGGVS